MNIFIGPGGWPAETLSDLENTRIRIFILINFNSETVRVVLLCMCLCDILSSAQEDIYGMQLLVVLGLLDRQKKYLIFCVLFNALYVYF